MKRVLLLVSLCLVFGLGAFAQGLTHITVDPVAGTPCVGAQIDPQYNTISGHMWACTNAGTLVSPNWQWSQIPTNGGGGSGTATGITSGTLAAIPATCTVNAVYFATDAPAGLNLYECTATNTWTRAPYSQGTASGKPATCTQGQIYFATDATAGQNLYYCTATNTWTQQLNSGSGATFVEHSPVNSVSGATSVTVTGTGLDRNTLNLTGNATLTISGQTAAQFIALKACQDATGGRTLSFGTGFTTSATINPEPNVCTTEVFQWDGSAATFLFATLDSGHSYVTEQTNPATTPASGQGFFYAASDLHNLAYANNAGDISRTWKLDGTTLGNAGDVASVITTNILSRATDQSGADNSCSPSSASGTAYVCNTGTGGPTPALTSYATTEHPILFTPDVASGVSPTINISGLGPKNLQKNVSGTLTNITTNDLTANTPYLLYPVLSGGVVSVFEVQPTNFSAGGAFSALTSGTNTTAAMLCGAGCTLGPTSTGTIQATSVVDSSQLPGLSITHTASAVDYFTITNAATGNPSTITFSPATGGSTSTNVSAKFTAKGTGLTYLTNPGGSADSQCTITIGSDKYGRYACIDNQGQLWLGNSATITVSSGSTPFSNPGFDIAGSSGEVDVYNTIGTAGMGLPPIYASPSYATAQSASVSATNLQCGGAICAAGQYCVVFAIDTTNGQAGTGNIVANAIFTNGASRTQSAASMALTAGNSASPHLCLHSDGSANIQFSITYTSTGQFDYNVSLLRFN